MMLEHQQRRPQQSHAVQAIRWTAVVGLVAIGVAPYVSIGAQHSAKQERGAAAKFPGPVASIERSMQQRGVTSDTISIEIKDQPLSSVVRILGQRANLGVVFDQELTIFKRKISARIVKKTVLDAYAQVLQGTGMVATISSDGETILIRPTPDSVKTQEQRGRVQGKVTDSATQEPLAGVTVTIRELRQAATSSRVGSFSLNQLPAGEYTLVAKFLGYKEDIRKIQISDDRPSVVQFALRPTATTLSGVVTTATGAQRSYEVGNDITRINVDEVRKYNDITSVSDLLANRVPGMFMQSGGGDAGAGDRIRIRGVHSITLSNDPILIVDGVRYQTIGQSEVEGRQGMETLSSRLNDIDPASIETIEVFKGPSAATLYGPDAVNGVIVITRKRGQAGETRWSVNANTRLSGIPRSFPGTVTTWGKSVESNEPYPCSASGLMGNQCIVGDSIVDYSLLNDDRFTTMGRGHNHDIGVAMQTGSSLMQLAVNIRASDVLGPTKLSQAGVERLQQLKGSVPSWVRRPNAQQQVSGSANAALQSLPLFDVGLQASLTHLDLRNSGNGIGRSQGVNDSLEVLPEQEFLNRKEESTDQSTASVTISTRQWSQFNWSGTFGMTYGKSLRDDWLRAEDCLAVDCASAEGARTKSSQTTAGYTINSWAGVKTKLSSWGTLRSTVGLNSFRSNQDFFSLKGTRMPFGVSDPTIAPVIAGITQSTQSARAGAYLQEQLQIGNRLFLNGAIRRDVGSGLGQSAKTPTFPSVNVSWIASETSLAIPLIGVLNTVRVRTSHGQSGQQPSVSNLYAGINRGTAWYDGVNHPAYIYNSLGNSYIKPERSRESEFGIDLELRGIIEALNVTYFHTITSDALASNAVAMESGLPDRIQTQNIGKLRNTGVEATTSLRLIDNPVATWNLNVSFSQTRNTVLSLGSYSDLGGTFVAMRVVEGYPLYGFWTRPIYGYEDRDHDGVLAEDEYVIGDSMVYAGWNQPKYSMVYSSSIGLFRGNVRLSSSFSQNSGVTKFTGRSSMIDGGSAIGDLEGQLRSKLFSDGLQTVSSLAWKSADLTMQLPSRIFRRLRARSGTFSVSTTNLYVWTNYGGSDPNVGPLRGYADSGITPDTRNWTLRFTLNY